MRLITSAEYKQRLVRTLSQLPLGSAHRRCAGTWFIPSNGGRNGAGIRLWFGSTRLLLSVDRPRPENPADQRRARIYCRYRSFQRGISLRIRTLHSMSLCRASRLSTYSVIRCICCSSPGAFSSLACSQGRRSIRADHSEYFQVRPPKPSTQDYERMGGTGRKTQSSHVLAISGEGQLRFTPCP